jgi:hypothetical protein
MLFILYHYICERKDTPFWKKVYKIRKKLPYPLNELLDSNYNIKVKTDEEFFKYFSELKTIGPESYHIINKGSSMKKSLI